MSRNPIKILITEDSRFFSAAIQYKLKKIEEMEIYLATSYKEAEELIVEHDGNFFLALLDLNLPDAPNGEIIDLTHKVGIPSIIFSANLDKESRKNYYKAGVIDCVPKDSPASLEYFTSLVRRIMLNRTLTVLVVDDTKVMRTLTSAQLKTQKLKVICAKDGRDALEKLSTGVPIHLVLTDYEMPKMDGFDFIKELRRKYPKDQLPVIGMSAVGNSEIAIGFLKCGANDFIHKPFSYEELLCRVSQNLDLYNMIEDLKKTIYKDALTGLNNRRFLFEYGEELFVTKNSDIIVAMIDVDHFKSINDTYGHSAGDHALTKIAGMLEEDLGKYGIVARFGGEEFCVVMTGRDENYAVEKLEKARNSISKTAIDVGGDNVFISISIGVCSITKDNFDELVNEADKALYLAKEYGRNCLKIALDSMDDVREFPQRSLRGSARLNKVTHK